MNSPLLSRLTARLFDRPLIQNSFRGELIEEVVAMALEPEWEHCGGDWGSCDLLRVEGNQRLQVKQSAARQSWYTPGAVRSKPVFSIARKTGEWVGSEWVKGTSRNADIFVFAFHPVDDDTADHRNPQQWDFYVLREADLPDQASMRLSTLQSLAVPVSYDELKATVERLAATE